MSGGADVGGGGSPVDGASLSFDLEEAWVLMASVLCNDSVLCKSECASD